MINYRDFSSLRLENFVSNPLDIRPLKDFEFMGKVWGGQAVGFTEWLQSGKLISDTKSVSIDFDNHGNDELDKILSTLAVGLQKGMPQGQVVRLLGQPSKILSFVADRQTLEYLIGDKEKYYLSLTIQNPQGLIYLVMANFKEALIEVGYVPS